MALFRYFSPDKGLRVLAECELMVTPPKYLNDPFEASPVIKSKEDPKGYARRRMEELSTLESFEKHKADLPAGTTFEKFQRCFSPQLLEKMVAETPSINSEFQPLAPETISARVGVVCFAPDARDPTMWAKYSPSHDGLVIEFQQSHQLFSRYEFFEIQYSDEPVVWDPTSSTVKDDAVLFLSRKRLPWSSERESRLLVELAAAKVHTLPEGGRYFIPIEPEVIVSVTLGLRATDETRDRVIDLLRVPHFENVGLFKITKNTEAGTFERERLQALRNS